VEVADELAKQPLEPHTRSNRQLAGHAADGKPNGFRSLVAILPTIGAELKVLLG
jgi:hypothetical protein